MKKCLVTGASGIVGKKLISKLLNSGNYEITALDLKSTKSVKTLNKFKNKINIVYGDINDSTIMNALIKDHDVIIHLAGLMPPTTELHPNLANIIEYGGSKSIIDAIKELNPKAYFVFLSTTAVYGNVKQARVDSDINILNNDIYSQNKYKIEDYIKKNLTNYTIYRVPLIIEKNNYNSFMYNIPLNTKIEVITNSLVANALVTSLTNKRKLNKKIFNLSGGKKYQISTNTLYIKALQIEGVSLRFFLMRYFIPQNFYGHIYPDNQELNDILDFQKGSIAEYLNSFTVSKKFLRSINRFIAYFYIRKLSK